MELFAREDLRRAVQLAGKAGAHPKGYTFKAEAEIAYDLPDLKLGTGPIAEVEARYIVLTSDDYNGEPTWFFHGLIDADAEDTDRTALARWLTPELNAHFVLVRKIEPPTAEIMAHFR